MLQEHLIEVSNPREEERDYTTFLVVDHKIPLVYASNVSDVYLLPEVQDNIFTFAVTPNALNIAFNRSEYDQFDAALYDEMYQHLSFEDFTIRVNLRNDSRDPIEVTLYSVYADTTPIPYSSTVSLERRDELEIRFSDVMRDSVYTSEATEPSGIVVRKFADLPELAGS
jgi:hypothetical protein